MRKLIYGMNLSLDGYIAAPGDDIGCAGRATVALRRWAGFVWSRSLVRS
jgi:hypothetical protein